MNIIDTAASSYRSGREGDGGRRNVDGHDGGIVGVCTSFPTSYIFIVSFDGSDGEMNCMQLFFSLAVLIPYYFVYGSIKLADSS